MAIASDVEELSRTGGHERVLRTAYDLFSREGTGVSVDRLIATSGVARATFYRHFPSKDDLVLAFLERREQLWLHGWVEEQARTRASTGAGRLLAVFDLFDEWFHSDDFDGCAFLRTLQETQRTKSRPELASIEHLARIREVLFEFAREARAPDPDSLAREWHILMKGSIMAATEGDMDAAKRAQRIGRLLLRDLESGHAASA